MAAPIILANISVPLLGAVNTAVVGHLPEPYYIGSAVPCCWPGRSVRCC